MKPSLPPAPSAPWTERYETLRRHVLSGGELWETQPLGLVLWLARGMAGWMWQWTQVKEWTPWPAQARLPVCHRPEDGWQRQMTLVLAQMTLGHFQLGGTP
jgi:hypothetical protein